MLAYGVSKTNNRLSAKDFAVNTPHPHHGILSEFIGVFRWIVMGAETLASIVPFVGPVVSEAIATVGTSLLIGLDVISYEEGNIRSKKQLAATLAVEALGYVPIIGTQMAKIKTGGIVVKSIDSGLEQAKVEKVFIRGTKEYHKFNSLLAGDRTTTIRGVARENSVNVVQRVSKYDMKRYRQTYLRGMIKLGKEQPEAKLDLMTQNKFETLLQKSFESGSNKDLALIRNIKAGRQFRGNSDIEFSKITEQFSSKLRKSLIRKADDPKVLLDNLQGLANANTMTAKLNRIFASGEKDWATMAYWRNVKSGKAFRSGNFWYSVSHLFKTTNVAREVITKPVNNVIRHLRKYLLKINQRMFHDKGAELEGLLYDLEHNHIAGKEKKRILDKYFKKVGKVSASKLVKKKNYFYTLSPKGKIATIYKLKSGRSIGVKTLYIKQKRIRAQLAKEGHIFKSESFVMGYRKIDEDKGSVDILVHFNLLNTNAYTAGSKNRGGKKPVMLLNFPKSELRKWHRSVSAGSFYLRNIAMSRGGRALSFEIADELFSNFLTFIPLQALRNVLSEATNIKYFVKAVSKGDYFSSYGAQFKAVIKRLYIHKTGKLIGSLGYLGGHTLGKEGKRFGLGIARGFQHDRGQKLGSFRGTWFAKNVLPRAFKGTAFRMRRNKYGTHYLTATQAHYGMKRYGKQVRRTSSLFKF